MKNFKKILTITILCIIISSCSSKVSEQNNFEIVDQIMYSAVTDSVFPGAVLLFGIDQEVLYNKAFGNYTYDKNSQKIKTNSIFDLASVTKVVATTSAAMMLVNEEKLSLDGKVISYLPEFNNNGKENVTIRNLLLHNSGLAAFKKYYDQFSSGEEVLNDIMNLPLNTPPGEKFVYSDLGMITLQKVIEKITGQTIDEFLEQNLFSQLEMNKTMYSPSKELITECVPTELDNFYRMRLLQGEVHDERAYLLDGVAGHAGLFSTAEDLSVFVRMLLNGGIYNGHEFIDSAIIENWTTKQSEQSDRGLGWDTKTVDGYSSAGNFFSKNSFGHTGYTGTSVWVDKENKLFLILLSNRVHPTRQNRKISKFRPVIHDAVYNSLFQLNKE